ncbi:MAG: DUF362 domain-containing protein [Desulfovibrio sp.]|jgi:uncharacterized protein (DUF362 family)|nr:DUF362 domain-containing protein [Desulfovibrio sp.]
MAGSRQYPKMILVRQTFERPQITDVRAAMRAEMARLMPFVKPGQRVGITVGSRGIQNILTILEVAVQMLKDAGAAPVLLAAMGSHGGGTEEGQKEVLDSLGITEERLKAEIVTCNTGKEIGKTASGLVAYMLESAFAVDAIIPVNRVKTHTSFKGSVESGLLKKLVVGLGGPPGAAQFHNLGRSELLSPLLLDVGSLIIEKMPVIGGIAIVENGYEETAKIVAIEGKNFVREEPPLLEYSKRLMPSLPVERIDALVIEEMGKNYSGTGLDTNIIGRLRIDRVPEPDSPVVTSIAVLDLSEESHGNACGIGLCDFAPKSLVDKIDRKATYLNCLTTTFVKRAFIPMYRDTEEETLGIMMERLRQVPLEKMRVVFIPNTLFLTECYVSEAIAGELTDTSRFEICGEPRPVTFDRDGRLALRLSPRHS